MSGDCPIIVFAKAPVAGAVKTRLAPVLGADGAARLAAHMLNDALRRAVQAQLGPVELCCTPDKEHPSFKAAAAEGIRLGLQGEGDLGMRMQRALERTLIRHARALLIGTDAPALAPALLRQAAEALQRHDAVFVPASDGGYVLVGLARPCPQLFQHIDWSTDAVMRQTRQRAKEAGISLYELETVPDVDLPDDLVHVPKEWWL